MGGVVTRDRAHAEGASIRQSVPPNWQLPLAGWCLSTLLGLIGIAVSIANRAQRLWLTWISVAVGIAAVALLVLALRRTLRLVGPSPLGRRVLPGVHVGVHSSRWAQGSQDVIAAHDFFCRLLPAEEAPSLELMQALHLHNAQTVRLVEAEKTQGRHLVGLAILVPLTPTGVRDIRSGTLPSVDHVRLHRHVSRSWRRPAGVYIGGVAGSSQAGRAWALATLEALIQGAGTSATFARPASADGRRVMARAGFAPLGRGSAFWQLVA